MTKTQQREKALELHKKAADLGSQIGELQRQQKAVKDELKKVFGRKRNLDFQDGSVLRIVTINVAEQKREAYSYEQFKLDTSKVTVPV